MGEWNWSGNHEYPVTIEAPASYTGLAEIVAAADQRQQTIRVVGSRHSFNAIADGHVMVHLGGLPERFEVDRERSIVWVNSAMTYGRLAALLRPEQLAIHNLASLPHISIAGAISTGTHGSGSRNGNLATAVTDVEVMNAGGQRRVVSLADSPAFGVGLGALGIITAVALRTEPAFEVEQRVFEHLPWDTYLDNFDAITDAAYSVSAFTNYRSATVNQVWLKRRTDEPDNAHLLDALGATAATEARHPLPGESADACTQQLGVPGLWSDRLPHFRLDFTPSTGDEIQSEFFVSRSQAIPALSALRSIAHELSDALLVSEIRSIASDSIVMSPCFERDSVAFHFTWVLDQQLAERAAATVFDALTPFDPRVHWGKVFPQDAAARHAGSSTFLDSLADERFVNDWLRSTLPGQNDVA